MTSPTLDSRQRALNLGYRYLGVRERTVAEMRRYLEGKRVDPATIAETVDTLTEQHYLDDARYARQFAEDRRTLDHWGAERVERRLLAAGVDRDLVAAALAGQDASAELEAAVALLRRRFPTPPSTDRDRNRALGVLLRKGYELELAHDAIRLHVN
ncbi:MAG TPA: RecX family transcriptional regulator [Solirubrobacteraceae bacterium]|nr:RecX family transcriptional regulator [Solirubrobacteraceae bacterium]